MNLQIKVKTIDPLYKTMQSSKAEIYLPLENKWYRQEKELVGNRQFVVKDPDANLIAYEQANPSQSEP